ncbi:DUF2244 domain-containing protein [Thioclava sp. FR2]|uniref:DUF2244 domain-containing protein n=1 Tax=Thioclava sp. FR2 TaxID=3445780 RepID=UPI003EBD4DE1
MPYQWLPPDGNDRRLHLWPHRSLPRQGFVLFIGVTAALIALPLVTVIGSPVLWALLPFLGLAVAGIWWALMRSYKDGQIIEDLRLAPTTMELTRHGPHGRHQHWQANPYWVRVNLHAKGGPVPNYITLEGGPRIVEIGAFLSEEERITLARELGQSLGDLRTNR